VTSQLETFTMTRPSVPFAAPIKPRPQLLVGPLALLLMSCAHIGDVPKPHAASLASARTQAYAALLRDIQATDGHSHRSVTAEHYVQSMLALLDRSIAETSMFASFDQRTRPQPQPTPSGKTTPTIAAPTVSSSALPTGVRALAPVATAPVITATPSPSPASTLPKPPPAPPDLNAGIQLKLEPNFESWHGKVMFAFASDALSRAARDHIAKLVAPAKTSARVDVIGRTDASGDAQRNERLALGRAMAVRDFMIERGVTKEKFFTAAIPCLADDSRCDPQDPAAMRRVEVGLYRTATAALESPWQDRPSMKVAMLGQP
jgi:outer membrane protein OmpA-like peptidoglycan-associated protein